MNRDAPPPVGELILIAVIDRPQGLRGEVIASLMTDFPERFERQRQAWAFRSGSSEVWSATIERAWLHKGRVVLKLAGYDDMTSAEALRGVRLAVTRDELTALPPETYYDFDLVDCEVVTVGGEVVGRVRRVERFGAAPLLAVAVEPKEAEAAAGREVLIPLAAAICTEIDIARKRILVDPPDGLLDL
jgi:16S rRNA processing protein RimM